MLLLQQILDLTMVKNLDTGEVVSLKVAQEQITQGINPLTLHLMRLTSEFVGYCKFKLAQ